jgi:hypothetical protein
VETKKSRGKEKEDTVKNIEKKGIYKAGQRRNKAERKEYRGEKE